MLSGRLRRHCPALRTPCHRATAECRGRSLQSPYAIRIRGAVRETRASSRNWRRSASGAAGTRVFTWEAVWGEHAWVTLGAAAMATERIRLGTLLTPASRWRPWDLASAVGTVDRLSGGRAVMTVGLGALHEGWTAFEADEGRRARAEKLDECLAIYDGLMRGQPFSYDGKHYSARPTDFTGARPACAAAPPAGLGGRGPGRRTGRAAVAGAGRALGRPAARRQRQAATERSRPGRTSSPRSSPRCGSCGPRRGWPRSPTTSSSRPTAPGSSSSSTRRSRRRGRRPARPGGSRAGGAIERGPAGLAEVRRRIEAGPPA